MDVYGEAVYERARGDVVITHNETASKGLSARSERGKACYRYLLAALAVLVVTNTALIILCYVMVSRSNQDLEAVDGNITSISNILRKTREEASLADQNLEASLNETRKEVKKSSSLAGWYKAGNDYIYKRFYRKLSFEDAKRHCESFGGQVLSIGLRQENLYREIKKSLLAPQLWTGLNDIDHEGSWRWVDGGPTNPSLVKWNKNEPDGGRRENCVGIIGVSEKALVSDYPCSGLGAYICERKY